MPTVPDSPSADFMLVFRNAGADVHAHLTAEERVQLARRWNEWVEGLMAQGKVQHARPLALEGRVVSGPTGARVTDGPYAEGKEIIGGYVFLRVSDIEEAMAIARHCPGLPLGLTVEVRPVLNFSPVLDGVRGKA